MINLGLSKKNKLKRQNMDFDNFHILLSFFTAFPLKKAKKYQNKKSGMWCIFICWGASTNAISGNFIERFDFC